MEEQPSVEELLAKLLDIAAPLAPFDMPLLDAHGATLASDIYAGERLVLRSGSRIRSTQIGLAASIGLDRLPTLPHPRVVVISAGDDLVEPGQVLSDSEDEFETNSWMLTTAVREAGANGFRVHTIPDDHQELKEVIEDQLVRADLIVISGERHDESFALITAVLKELGEITTVRPKMSESGLHNFGLIGPDKTPVITVPGDPVVAGIAAEIFVRPMIRKMLGAPNIFRNQLKAKLKNSISAVAGESGFVRAVLTSENGVVVTALEEQGDLLSLSDANALIIVPEKSSGIKSGEIVDVMVLERSSN
ncbi:MAG: molybdopterin-binding protein [Candidatus Nanopelagicaceae bacterium]